MANSGRAGKGKARSSPYGKGSSPSCDPTSASLGTAARGGYNGGIAVLEVKFIGSQQQPSKEVSVQGLPYSVNAVILKDFLANQHGLELSRPPRIFSGRAGCRAATLAFSSSEDAARAIKVMDGLPGKETFDAVTADKDSSSKAGTAWHGADVSKDEPTRTRDCGDEHWETCEQPASKSLKFQMESIELRWKDATSGFSPLYGYARKRLMNGSAQPKGSAMPTTTEDDISKESVLTARYADNPHLPSSSVTVSGVPENMDKSELEGILAEHIEVPVVHVRLLPRAPGSRSTTANVQLKSREDAATFIDALDGRSLDQLTSPQLQEESEPTEKQSSVPLVTSVIGHAHKIGTLLVAYASRSGDPCDTVTVEGLPAAKMHPGYLKQVFTSLDCRVVAINVICNESGETVAKVQLASQMEATSAIEALSGQVVEVVDALLEQCSGQDVAAKEESTSAQKEQKAPEAPVVQTAFKLGVQVAGESEVLLRGLPRSSVSEETLREIFVNLGLHPASTELDDDHQVPGTSTARVQLASAAEVALAISALDGQELQAPQSAEGSASNSAAPPEAAASTKAANPPASAKPKAKAEASAGLLLQTELSVRYAGATAAPSDCIFITGLPTGRFDDKSLTRSLTELGLSVKRVRVIPGTQGGTTSSAKVQLATQSEAGLAITALRVKGTAASLDRSQLAGVQQEASPIGSTLPGQDARKPQPPPQASLHAALQRQAAAEIRPQSPLTNPRSVAPPRKLQWASGVPPPLRFAGRPPLPMQQAAGQPQQAGHQDGKRRSVLLIKYAGNDQSPSENLFVSGLPLQTDATSLKEIFTSLGLVLKRSKVIPDTKGAGYCSAMVQLESQSAAAIAIEGLNGQQVELEAV